MKFNTRIVIEPAKNGYIVTFEQENNNEVTVFGRRRALMHQLGKLIDELDQTRQFESDDEQ